MLHWHGKKKKNRNSQQVWFISLPDCLDVICFILHVIVITTELIIIFLLMLSWLFLCLLVSYPTSDS